ncbi:hypothetical protein DAEQUDRAFT_766633 [Daedalea quercina L-15889]|uniref:CCHC-type domain-containing protein n=1 Tax=Daedalea quercina L-15889 TaxID=1314783 RepID=A0A165PCX2_9APHY|nr:hypothetical protein DAEQUDRAFT_766633 [Daedalea quercina L-15889]
MAPKERQCHQELGLCFYCHKQGHLFRQYPERDKKRKENPKRRQLSGPTYETMRKVADEPPSFDEFLCQCDEKEWASRPKKPMQELVNEPQKILRTMIEEVPDSEWDFSPDPPDEPTSSILDEPIEELPNHPPMNPHDDPPEQEEDYEA